MTKKYTPVEKAFDAGLKAEGLQVGDMTWETWKAEAVIESKDTPFTDIITGVIGQGRWHEHQLMSFMFQGERYGITYSEGLTENQESEWHIEYPERVYEREVTTTERSLTPFPAK